jgi:hypothetical protein
MAVTRKGRSIIMTAASDVAGQNAIRCRQVRLRATGLTAGTDRLVIKEVDTNGAIVADHIATAANEDYVVWEAGDKLGSWIRKPFLDTVPGVAFEVVFQLS